MLSPEIQAQADEIRRNKSLVKSLQAERDLWKSKAMDSQEKLDQLSHKDEMSDEDRDELKRQAAELDALNDELEGAAQDNTKPEADANGAAPVSDGKSYVAPVGTDGAPTEPLTSGDVLAANGPANHPAGGTVPMMPTSAFDPGAGTTAAPSDAGQVAQPAAIETPGGFVIAGGGSTSRAPGSSPESPSSSLVVPIDPDAKAPASTADVVKSGLGDSSQNALLGNDGQPIADGPGMPKEPSPAAQEAAQEQADLQAKEKEAREANPLNLAPAGTPQAGSPGAEGQRLPADGSAPTGGNPAPSSTPVPGPNPSPVDEDKPNVPAA